jgi:hypothetical protein
MAQEITIPLGWTLPKRKKFLADLAGAQQSRYSPLIKFQGKVAPYPVYSVEISLPKYRLANGRTQAAQEEYLAKYPKLGPNFFTRDPELDEAQKVQHALLWQMVKKSKLLKYFQDLDNSQEQPLILSDIGFVINGNRRLCAMRELFYREPTKYSRYSHVDIVVLPHCTDKDIDELEASLQIQPDIKEDYTWIARACMLRARQKMHGYTDHDLSAIYEISEKEIQSIFQQLDLVDEYLQSRNKQKQYDLVEEADYAFKQMRRGRQLLKRPEERDLFTQVSYCLIDNSQAAGGRLYERIPEVKENLNQIAERLTTELPVDTSVSEPKSNYDLFGPQDTISDLEPVIGAVARPENRDIVVDTVIDVIDGQKEIERKRTRVNAVLKQITDANAHLKTAINCITDDTGKQGVEEQLQSIEESIIAIREWLTNDA